MRWSSLVQLLVGLWSCVTADSALQDNEIILERQQRQLLQNSPCNCSTERVPTPAPTTTLPTSIATTTLQPTRIPTYTPSTSTTMKSLVIQLDRFVVTNNNPDSSSINLPVLLDNLEVYLFDSLITEFDNLLEIQLQALISSSLGGFIILGSAFFGSPGASTMVFQQAVQHALKQTSAVHSHVHPDIFIDTEVLAGTTLSPTLVVTNAPTVSPVSLGVIPIEAHTSSSRAITLYVLILSTTACSLQSMFW